jgi:uncharacterized protein (DUF1697 family)
MARYVALLRGINVGGRNRVAMADLRQLTGELGHTEVATYIRSGNVVFTSPNTDCLGLADALEREITRSLAVRSELAAQLGRSSVQAGGTARNWATVTRLMAMVDSDV